MHVLRTVVTNSPAPDSASRRAADQLERTSEGHEESWKLVAVVRHDGVRRVMDLSKRDPGERSHPRDLAEIISVSAEDRNSCRTDHPYATCPPDRRGIRIAAGQVVKYAGQPTQRDELSGQPAAFGLFLRGFVLQRNEVFTLPGVFQAESVGQKV
jgi:hypothetical protein